MLVDLDSDVNLSSRFPSKGQNLNPHVDDTTFSDPSPDNDCDNPAKIWTEAGANTSVSMDFSRNTDQRPLTAPSRASIVPSRLHRRLGKSSILLGVTSPRHGVGRGLRLHLRFAIAVDVSKAKEETVQEE